MQTLTSVLIRLVLLSALAGAVSVAHAQSRDATSLVAFSRADSIAIEREAVRLMQNHIRFAFRDRTAPMKVLVRYADGRERTYQRAIEAALLGDGVPAAARGDHGVDTMVVELGAYHVRRPGSVSVAVRVLGPAAGQCRAYWAIVIRHEGGWNRYVPGQDPLGCFDAQTSRRAPELR
jgi:hypothetical protein